jgi:hypothetical protein
MWQVNNNRVTKGAFDILVPLGFTLEATGWPLSYSIPSLSNRGCLPCAGSVLGPGYSE